MSRTNANSKWPLTRVKALARHGSAVLRSLKHWVSHATRWLFANNALPPDSGATKKRRSRQTSRLFLMYTENPGRAGLHNIKSALDSHFPGYTLEQNAFGRYKRNSEDSVVARVLTHDRNAIRGAAAEICERNNQESVLCVELLVASQEFISSSNSGKAPGGKPASQSASAGRLHHHLGRRKRSSSLPRTIRKVKKGL